MIAPCLLLGLAGCTGALEGASDAGTALGPDGAVMTADASGADAAHTTSDAGRRDGGMPVLPDERPRIYLRGEVRTRLEAAIAARTPAALRLIEMLDAELAGSEHYAFRASDAALLFVLTGEARYADFAIARVDAWVRAEEARIAGGERAEVSGDSYLAVGEIVGDMAMVYDWCWARMDASTRARWRAYGDQAVWNVWHHEDATWGGRPYPWSGWSVDDPSNNYFYSFLEATMLLGLATRGESDSAETWISTFRDEKIGGLLIPTFARDLVGGGSREGTGYGTAMGRLFRLYELWRGSTGEDLSVATDHARSSLAYLIHATVPTLDRLAPIGDHSRDSSALLFDYHRSYALALMRLSPEDPLSQVGRSFVDASSVPRMANAFMFLYDFLHDPSDIEPRPLSWLSTTYRAAGAGHVFARSSWGPDATWLGFVAGPYTQSHAHRDQGSILVYRREWLAFDANVVSHSGILQQEDVHSLVRVSDSGAVIPQREGAGPAVLRALRVGDGWTWMAADLTPAYGGTESIDRQEREIVVLWPDVIVIADRIDARAGTTRTFGLVTPFSPMLDGSVARMRGAHGELALHRVSPTSATMSAVRMPDVEPDTMDGYRVDVRDDEPSGRTRMVHVLSIDGAVRETRAEGDASHTGVLVVRADGSELRVRFDTDAIGASIEVGGAAHTPTMGIDEIPLSR